MNSPDRGELKFTRRYFTTRQLPGFLLAAATLSQIKPLEGQFDTDVVAEPFKFETRGGAIAATFEQFGAAHLNETGEDVTPHIDLITKYSVARISRGDQGICHGITAYQEYKRGIVPENGSDLGGIHFTRDQIMTLGGLVHMGDADSPDPFGGNPDNPALLQYLLNTYLRSGQIIGMDFSPDPAQVFMAPSDRVIVESIKDSGGVGGYQGWSRVALWLRFADYLDAGFGHPGESTNSATGLQDPGYRYKRFVYSVDSVENPTQGVFSNKPFVKKMSRADLTHYMVQDSDGSIQALPYDDPGPNLGNYRTRGIRSAFTRSMLQSFNALAGEAVSIDPITDDVYGSV